MASINPRKNNKGEITSYTLRVYQGYDSKGKRVKPHTLTWKPAPGMTAKQIEKELQRQVILFEEQCKAGGTLDNRQNFTAYSEYVLTSKQNAGTKHRTIERYRELLERVNAGIGHIKLADMRPQHLSNLYDQLRQPGIRKDGNKAVAKVDFKELICLKRITQQELSDKSGVSLATIRNACQGIEITQQKAGDLCTTLKEPINKVFEVLPDGRTLSEKTIQEHHRLISMILSQAEKEMLIPYNPAVKVINKPKAERTHEVNYFEVEELERIRSALDTEPLKWRVITHLLLVTGCRRGEIVGLKWCAVDFVNNQIDIKNNLLYSKKYGIYQDSTKTETSNRTVKLPDETMGLLKEYRDYWEDMRRTYSGQWHGFIDVSDNKGVKRSEKADFLFFQENANNTGYPMHPDSVTDWLNKFSRRHGLPHINPHAFRHTLASVLCFNGVDMTTISKWLGHKSVSTTQNFYQHLLDGGKERVVNTVADVILKSQKA